MATQAAVATGLQPPDPQVTEREARFLPGPPMLVLGIVGLLVTIAVAVVASHQSHGASVWLGLLCALIVLVSALVLGGLTLVVPGRARADTARAFYSVDDYAQFVTIQTETAVRHIASSYPYTSRTEDELALRDNADEITGELFTEIAARVASAGVRIIESRLTRLSYAPEIAQAIPRQQQASAVVGARRRIVEGAVGMVQLALQRLQDEDVVELDEERKASMVSNLLVVLCSEQATQPIVNTGTLYQ